MLPDRTGVLIFAYNNSHFDYLKMAEWSTKNIHRHLDLPVTVVTDVEDTSGYDFDDVVYVPSGEPSSRHFIDIQQNVDWYNKNRVDAFNISPYDTTIVIDADYVVASSNIRRLLYTSSDFMCHRYAYDLCFRSSLDGLNFFGQYSMPMWWATLMIFEKTRRTEMVFDVMRMVRDHWDHYRHICEFDRSTYRNDYALSIALNVTKHRRCTIPWNLASVLPECKLEQEDKDAYSLTYEIDDRKMRTIVINGIDFHAMGKKDLGEIIDRSV